MTTIFDDCALRYRTEVQSSIDFSGLRHDFFLEAKAEVVARTLRNRFGVARPSLALDIGCGIGLLHSRVAPMFHKLAAVDSSAVSVEQARRLNPSVEYSVVDQSLPYDSGTFDVTLTVCVLHHVPPQNWPAFMGEMLRVTRPGGLICVIEHNPLNPLTQLAVSRCSFDADAVLLRASQTAALLKGAGASDISTEFFLAVPFRGGFMARLGSLFRRLPFGAQYLISAKA
jgi:SAM-dependent methyltransferase